MPLYRVFINNKDTGEYVRGSSWEDAFSDVSATKLLKYEDVVHLEKIQESSFQASHRINHLS